MHILLKSVHFNGLKIKYIQKNARIFTKGENALSRYTNRSIVVLFLKCRTC